MIRNLLGWLGWALIEAGDHLPDWRLTEAPARLLYKAGSWLEVRFT